MSLKSSWLRPGIVAATILGIGAIASQAAAAPAAAGEVAGVDVASAAPTSLAVSIVDKTPQQVLRDIRTTARIVCRNAYLDGPFGPYAEGYAWCPYRTVDTAYSRYEAILKANPELTVAALTVAAPAAR